MPLLLKPIAVFLAMILGPLVARVLAALGLGIVTYNSIEAGVGYLEGQIALLFGGVGGDILSVLRMAGFAEFMSIIFSAWVSVLAIQLVAGAVKKITFVPSK